MEPRVTTGRAHVVNLPAPTCEVSGQSSGHVAQPGQHVGYGQRGQPAMRGSTTPERTAGDTAWAVCVLSEWNDHPGAMVGSQSA